MVLIRVPARTTGGGGRFSYAQGEAGSFGGVSVVFALCGQELGIAVASRSQREVSVRSIQTFSRGSFVVDSNTHDAESFMRISVNGVADLGMSIVIPASTSGTFFDDVGTTTVAVGDDVAWIWEVTGVGTVAGRGKYVEAEI